VTITVISHIEIGDIPSTPLSHDEQPQIATAYAAMLNQAMAHGYCVGYAQEQGGRLIQSIFPTRSTEKDQISTSSKAALKLHTEAAFHPYRPDYVLLLCLRGDLQAATTYADVRDIIPRLSAPAIDQLLQRNFVTTVDKSYLLSGQRDERVPMSILTFHGPERGYTMAYDADLTKSVTPEAQAALDELETAIADNVKEIVLRRGDLLMIDNHRTIHGRKPFTARYDGTDRWLLRTLVVRELPPPSERTGSIITTSTFRR